MKSKLLIICILLGVGTMQQASASDPRSYSAAIGDFINGHVNTDPKKLAAALSDDVSFRIPRQERVLVQSKDELLSAMRKDAGVVQNCTSSYQLIAKTDALILARVDFKYPGFVQHNFITLEKGSKDWKITEVCKISENNETAKSGAFPVVTTID